MQYARFTAAPAAVTNRFVASTNMANGAYTLAATTMPTAGARKVTVTHTAVTGNDTLGTITVVGTNLAGQPITEVITPVAGGTATGTKYFRTIVSATQAGWVINVGNDTLVIGCDATPVVLEGSGQLHSVVIGATAAGTITLADASGTIWLAKASIVEGSYLFDVDVQGFLSVVLGAASDVTVTFGPQTNIYG